MIGRNRRISTAYRRPRAFGGGFPAAVTGYEAGMADQQSSGGVGRAARSAVRTTAGGGGSLLRSTFALVARARPAEKPLHPVGAVSRATLHRYGLSPSV